MSDRLQEIETTSTKALNWLEEFVSLLVIGGVPVAPLSTKEDCSPEFWEVTFKEGGEPTIIYNDPDSQQEQPGLLVACLHALQASGGGELMALQPSGWQVQPWFKNPVKADTMTKAAVLAMTGVARAELCRLGKLKYDGDKKSTPPCDGAVSHSKPPTLGVDRS